MIFAEIIGKFLFINSYHNFFNKTASNIFVIKFFLKVLEKMFKAVLVILNNSEDGTLSPSKLCVFVM